jgi:RecA-family ATPase
MIAGPPNGGKTLFALHIAVSLQKQAQAGGRRIPTLYVSADTDPVTMLMRAYAMVSGHDLTSIEQARDAGLGEDYEHYVASMTDFQFLFESDPSLADLDVDLRAFREIYGELPALLIVDNLMNVQAESDSEWAGMRAIMQALHHVARVTGAAVIVLHHTSEDSQYPVDRPPPRRAIQGKVAQLAELILTLTVNGNMLGMAVVKNRNGRSDPTADHPIWLRVDFARMAIIDQFYGETQ